MHGQTTHMYRTLVDAYHTVLLRMREKNLVLPLSMIFALCGGAVFHPGKAHAATLTWDTTIAGDGVITDGSGVWTAGSGGWNNGATSVSVNWSNSTPDNAVFTGTAGGIITVDAGGVTANGLTFNVSVQ